MDDSTYAFLQSLALTGKLAAVLGGPPCRTYSLSRYMPPGFGEGKVVGHTVGF